MPLLPPKNRTAYGTYLYFVEPGTLETFLQDYRRILIDNLQKIRIEGSGEYWSCGQDHDPRNWNWKPWQHLERLCRKRGLDDIAVRDILFEHLGRKLECDCQALFDERELRKEALIPIDMVGGTSLGAIVAAGVAMGWDDGRMLEEYRAAFVDVNPANDYTLPVFSIIRGKKMSSGLRRHFGDTLIEDLWIPFFAVSSNLSSGHETVHRTGLLWRSLRSSASLSAIFPPIIENSEVLVDGGILNNLPVNVVKDSMGGYVIP